MSRYIWTLDSHDYIGPFGRDNEAHKYAKENGYTSYQLISNLPLNAHIIRPKHKEN